VFDTGTSRRYGRGAFIKEARRDVAKPDLGTKRVCPSCGTKYYDLNRDPIVCPNCGTVFVIVATPVRAQSKPEPAPKPVPVAEVEVEREADVVSLEEVEEGAEPDVGPDTDDEETVEIPDDPEIEVADDEDDAVPDPFIEEEGEEGADVAGLLDVDEEDEEER
jgi:uncharacterized protein (TIGR02300 family)